jgi:hypothetical protein
MQGGSDSYAIFGQTQGAALVRFDGVNIQNTGNTQVQYVVDNTSINVTGFGMALNDGAGTVSLVTGSLGGTYMIDSCSFKNLAFGIVIGHNVFAGNGVDGAPALLK